MSMMMPVISTSHLGLINTKRFFRNCYFVCGSNHMCCDLIGPFLQTAFRQFCLWCESNRLWLDNSVGGEVSPHTSLHHCECIISCLNVLRHHLTFGRFTRVPSIFTYHIKGGLYFSVFILLSGVTNIGVKRWCMGNSMRNWEVQWYQMSGRPHFLVEKGKVLWLSFREI